jgi:hypothetical protein
VTGGVGDTVVVGVFAGLVGVVVGVGALVVWVGVLGTLPAVDFAGRPPGCLPALSSGPVGD